MLSQQYDNPFYFSFEPYYSYINNEIDLSEFQLNQNDMPRVIEFLTQHKDNARQLTLKFHDHFYLEMTALESLAKAVIGLKNLVSLKLINPSANFLDFIILNANQDFLTLKNLYLKAYFRTNASFENPVLRELMVKSILSLIKKTPNLESLAINGFILKFRYDEFELPIAQLTHLQHLSIKVFHLHEQELESFFKAIADKKILTLKIKVEIGPKGVINFSLPQLNEIIDLSINSDPPTFASNFLKKINPNCLRKLELNTSRLQLFADDIIKFTKLESLKLTNFNSNCLNICDAIRSLSHLKALKIEGFFSEEAMYARLLAAIQDKKDMQSFNICFNNGAIFNATYIIEFMAQALTYLKQIEKFKLKCRIGELTEVISNLQNCPNLTSLSIECDSLPSADLAKLAEIIQDTAVTLANISCYNMVFLNSHYVYLIAGIANKPNQSNFIFNNLGLNSRSIQREENQRSPAEKAQNARSAGFHNVQVPTLTSICTFFVSNELRKTDCRLKLRLGSQDQPMDINRDNVAQHLTNELIARLQRQ